MPEQNTLVRECVSPLKKREQRGWTPSDGGPPAHAILPCPFFLPAFSSLHSFLR